MSESKAFVLIKNTEVFAGTEKKPLFTIRNFCLKKGQRLLVEGRSGSGKTTFLHMIAGLFVPEKGEVNVLGQKISGLSPKLRADLRLNDIGIIFQKLNLIDHLTAIENALLGIRNPTQDDLVRTQKALEEMGLKEQLTTRASKLSLGEQQRVAVARVLTSQPKLLLADEPTSSLDDENTDFVIKKILSLPEETSILMVSHDPRVKKYFAEHKSFSEVVQ